MSQLERTVLIIDDSPAERETYRRYLEPEISFTYTIWEAESAEAALQLCDRQLPDGIVLDYVLPDMDGLEFLAELQHRFSPCPPVVMMTGYGNETIAVKAIKTGADDYLVKSELTPGELRLAVRSVITNAELQRQIQRYEQQFRTSVENMLDCFGIFAAIRDQTGQIIDFRFEYLNTAALESNRMTQADLGKRMCEVFPAQYESGLFAEYCKVVETGQPLVKEALEYSDQFGEQHLTRTYDLRVSKLNDGFVASWRDITERKRTELERDRLSLEAKQARQQAEANHQRYRAIFDTTFQFTGLLNPDGIVREVNQSALNFGGLTHADVLNHPFWETRWWTISPETQAQLRNAIARAAQGEFMRYEVEILGAGDLKTMIDFSLKPVYDELGKVVLLIPEGRDISDRKRFEVTLQKSEALNRQILETSPDCIKVLDLEGRIQYMSPACHRLLGITDESYLNVKWVEFWQGSDQQQLQKALEKAIGGETSKFQGYCSTINKVPKWWEVIVTPIFNSNGEVEQLLSAARDITDRQEAEIALQQSEQHYRSLAELIPQLVWTANSEGIILEVNQRWLDFTGFSLAQIRVTGWEAIIHPEDLPLLRKAWAGSQQDGSYYQAEGRIRRIDGSYRWYLHQALSLKNEQNQIIKWFGTATDIENQKQLEAQRDHLLQEAQAARKEAEAANSSKDEFIAIVAHELRSPLNSVMGWAKMLQSRTFDAATTAKALETIARNTQAQVQLIDDLLDISRMIRGTLKLTQAPVNLGNVIEAVLAVVSPMAAAKQIQLEAQILQAVTLISGDFNRLQQIVINLLTNAIKFTPVEGQVKVVLEVIANQACLQISDTGKGIAPEFLPHIFERFQQAQKNTGSKDGLGLGLAIVRHLVELHGGTITATSAGVKQGATFTLVFPLLEAKAEKRQDENKLYLSLTPGSASLPLAGISILAVDDEPDSLEMLRFTLEQFGAVVESVTTATMALNLLSQFQPDILLCDIAMPEMNGYELLRQIRQLQTGQIPAIAITAYASLADQEKSLQAGFQQHFSKPVEAEALVTAIVNLVQK